MSDQILVAKDHWGADHPAPASVFKLRVSVYGLMKENELILVQRSPLVTTFSLPGGAIEIGESLEEGIIREFQEETGLTIQPKKLLGASQSLFTFSGNYYHNILMLYEVSRVSGDLTRRRNHEDSVETRFYSRNELIGGQLHYAFTPFSQYL